MNKRDYRIVRNLDNHFYKDELFLEVLEVNYSEDGTPFLPAMPTDDSTKWATRSKMRAFEKSILLLSDGKLTETNQYFDDSND